VVKTQDSTVEIILAFESAFSSMLTNTVNCLKFPVLWVKSSISENKYNKAYIILRTQSRQVTDATIKLDCQLIFRSELPKSQKL